MLLKLQKETRHGAVRRRRVQSERVHRQRNALVAVGDVSASVALAVVRIVAWTRVIGVVRRGRMVRRKRLVIRGLGVIIAGMVSRAATACFAVTSAVCGTGHSPRLGARCARVRRTFGNVSVMATASQHGMRDEREQRQDMSSGCEHVD